MRVKNYFFQFKPHCKTFEFKKIEASLFSLRKIKEKPQKNTHFSWKMSEISLCRLFENLKSIHVMVDKYLIHMLVLSERDSKL